MKKIITALLLLVTVSMTAADLKYSSEQLKAACDKAGLGKIMTDSVLDADTVVMVNGRALSVRISNGEVQHIGCKIFSKEQRQLMPSPAYDYLEFACLDKKLGITENPFVYKNLTIQGGTWDDILANAQNSACSVSRLDNVAYKVQWTVAGGKEITATFPIGYESLYMMSRTEIERKFIKELRDTKASQQADIAEPDQDMLKGGDNGVLVKEGDHYIITEVNQNLYYQKTDSEGLILIWDKKYPAESMANMLVSHDKWLTGYPVKMRIPTHERKTEEITVTVRQLLAYAHKTGCEVYWGLESLTETELKGTLFMYNAAYGYDHVLNITCDPRQIGSNELELTALVALFSPTTNVNNLFAKSKGKSKPKKIE